MMWQKPFALFLCLSLFSPCLSAQDMSPEDRQIIANQAQIISIVQSLKESDRISEQNLQAEREAWKKEKDELLKEKESWISTERDIAILKSSLETQSKSLKKERDRADAMTNGCRILAVVAAALGAYSVIK